MTVAIGKAYTAASFGLPTSDTADGQTVGGIAASGGTGEQDVDIVQAALT